MKPVVMAVNPLPPMVADPLRASCEFHEPQHLVDSVAFATLAPRVRALVGIGESIITREFIARFPALELIAIFGVGYDGVDTAAALERGIAVTHTPNVLTDDVADLAIGLVLAAARQIPRADRFVRDGQWERGDALPFGRKVSGARLGIIGLGRIGSAIARRASAFAMQVSYTDRAPIPEVAYPFAPTAVELARDVDFLVVAAYGGPTTRGLVDANVLDALGARGFLVNVARGSVVDEPALLAALQQGRIAGAALDVFADEPRVPTALSALPNVVLTPHMASATTETRRAMAELTLANVAAHFAGNPLPTPIPA